MLKMGILTVWQQHRGRGREAVEGWGGGGKDNNEMRAVTKVEREPNSTAGAAN